MRGLVLGIVLVWGSAAAAQEVEKLEGYAEWRRGEIVIVDGQQVRPGPGMKFKGRERARDWASIPLGYELKVKGRRGADGVVVATEVDARPNGDALFEGDLRSSFDATEEQFLQIGRMFEQDGSGAMADIGELHTEGPEVDRVRHILEDLVPPYTSPEEFRIYVVDNDEWNAMAAPNGSIYVFSGLLRDMDDDEVAIVLGHELVHVTHEHSRKGFKKQLLVMLGAAAVDGAVEASVDDKGKRTAAQIGTFLLASALSSGYGRDHEDQADRAGMRYAWEAGYDVQRAPALWRRFADKYGDQNKVVNFFFGDHSAATARASRLERELERNYRRER